MLRKKRKTYFDTIFASILIVASGSVWAKASIEYDLSSNYFHDNNYTDAQYFISDYHADLKKNTNDFIQFRNTGKTFIFDPAQLRWYAYNTNGGLVGSGRASGGRHYCPDVKRRCRTPVGTFSVTRKGSAGCVSSKFPIGRGGAPMPYCMFFKGGYAIHGSPDVPDYNASHGCIRVEPGAARWLSHNFMDHGTTVIVRPYK